MSMLSEKIYIPVPGSQPRTVICGILQKGVSRPRRESDTGRQPVAIVAHGMMCHKNSIFQPKLCDKLPMDSFRFDFRGNAESPASWSISGFDRDIEDLEIVAEWLMRERNYNVDLVIGHSRGALTTMRWITLHQKTLHVRRFIPITPRYRMERIHDRDNIFNADFEKQGYHMMKFQYLGKPAELKVTPEAVEEFARWDTTYVANEFPSEVDVLLLAAEKDRTMPLGDSILYAQAFEARPGARVSWHMIENCDHLFYGFTEEVCQAVTSWLRSLDMEVKPPKFWPALSLPRSKL